VLKWLLGDPDHSTDGGGAVTSCDFVVVLRWWELATFSIRHGMLDVLKAVNDEGMDQDGQEPRSTKTTRLVLEYLDTMLSYVIRRTGSMLHAPENEKGASSLRSKWNS